MAILIAERRRVDGSVLSWSTRAADEFDRLRLSFLALTDTRASGPHDKTRRGRELTHLGVLGTTMS